PPRITWASSGREALALLAQRPFDLIITMTRLDDVEPMLLCGEIKGRHPQMPIYYLSHEAISQAESQDMSCRWIDRQFVWLGNTDLLLALIKNTEDRMNVDFDTQAAGVRVILIVEDSPLYLSSVLPFIYKEIVRQTQSAMDESLNEEHRILRMRARPKILTAETFEEAQALYECYAPFMLTALCDARFPRHGRLAEDAGLALLTHIQQLNPELPLMLLSSEPANHAKADRLGAHFIDKNSSSLHDDIRAFFVRNLGFEEFVFRLPDGRAVGRAADLRAMTEVLNTIPDASIEYHARREDFSTWMMARMEIELAQTLRAAKVADFTGIPQVRDYILQEIVTQRKERQRGIVVEFSHERYDPAAEFAKIGSGSLGGKARGLAFFSSLLKNSPELLSKYPQVEIGIPRTLVISTDGFEQFLSKNRLRLDAVEAMSDGEIEALFAQARFPETMKNKLASFLQAIQKPLAVRSSGLLEDAQAQPSAGMYKTVMIPNQHPNPEIRLAQLLRAVQRVYASTYFAAPRAFARRSPYRTEEDRMAVIIQPIVGTLTDGYYYPAISGVAQSFNFYPVSYMKAEEGIVHAAMGLGRTVVEGGVALHFSPRYPQLLPQIDSVPKALKNAQRFFYALNMNKAADAAMDPDSLIESLCVDTVTSHPAVQALASTYDPADQRIRDSASPEGQKLITFAGVLKYHLFPLGAIVEDLLEIGRRGMGCPVEIEFAVRWPQSPQEKYFFALLQIRPMAKREQSMPIAIAAEEEQRAVCLSRRALGNGLFQEVRDIVFVKPETFDPALTVAISAEIASLNQRLEQQGRRYVLIGPGRWGSADRWLGIPVGWKDISAVAAIVETSAANLNADPSQGSHFFHNITALGIGYFTITSPENGHLDLAWLQGLTSAGETTHVRHVTLEQPLTIKIDGKSSVGVIMAEEQ
ncbi:MAG: phosphoenolpyruvate synthase/pyruvate phosphate dikinase, partial [Desulfobacteraceae bacterium]|nr:phosphoenolpyruvate synthase/pyruvate phosphate dikinase [Desulfobacteraceae bacterium]